MSSEKYITVYMRDYMREYRASHPEYVIKENEKTNERLVNKYNSDSDYKERKKQQALARYYRLKQEKQQAITSN
jgi:hypothetical protein